MDTQMVFERYEIKYLLDRKQKESVLQAMEPYMELDGYGRSTIRNIYYDTDNYRLVRTSLEKPVYKEKLRVRSYQAAEPEDRVFVELKKKYDSVVYKRRVPMAETQAMEYLAGATPAPVHTHITEEIDYFLKFYQTLAPRMFLSYEREAYCTREPGEFRVTFDENILFREEDLSLECGVYGEALLEPGQTLMEIKTPGGIPLWMVKALTEEKLHKASFSKYGNAYQAVFMREKGEVVYA
ncbi:MAG: polyphosphate polymerase domain-containing protein [Eubacterium sp.]|nr:polyphosphate polymerase domain-containing protein [Eubacterium sp.]MCM1216282.1 polyphosphate polymerase domain-containing protein [Lachnospiraceae bacterium]MCM1303793.1 polyphosphate polymerase domain-containing protein [Butyrivibrio sp.]MCM1342835.1 polyphosphate polymerase domain-containing protein [Muribaculaceae bacterium]MCM1240049.1 polyphosphate polymerase domain-containing protein [Lachnospiraceae bacterium]